MEERKKEKLLSLSLWGQPRSKLREFKSKTECEIVNTIGFKNNRLMILSESESGTVLKA